MKHVLGMSLCGLLLAGCAGGGRYVSAGPLDYGKLMAALRCEVAEVYELDRRGLRKLEGWQALIDVKIKGIVDRDAGLAAGVQSFGLRSDSVLTADIGADRRFTDSGTILLSDKTNPDAPDCEPGAIDGYDLSNLDLSDWYRKIEARMVDEKTAGKVESIVYERVVRFKFLAGKLEVVLFSPGWVTPGMGFSSVEEAFITITFQTIPGPAGIPVVALDGESLRALAEIIRSGGTSVPARTRASRPAAPELDPVQRDRLRELERLDDRLRILNRSLLLE